MKNKITDKIFDYIFIGGGCASLSLALKISNKDIKIPCFLILEERKLYKDDRSWCYWSKEKKTSKHIIEKSWDKWSFSFSNNSHIHEGSYFKYNYVRSITFYKKALKVINQTKNININLNEKVVEVKKEKGIYKITSNTKVYFAYNVLDTRPKINSFKKYPFLYQSFFGYEVSLNRNCDFLNIPYLMKNMRASNNQFIFEYILPIKKNLYLIETTIFAKKKYSEKYIKNLLHLAIEKMGVNKYKIKRKEYGIIPMGFLKNKKYNDNQSYIYGGLSAGAGRASSGFAFLNIQNWAENCSNNIKRKGKLIYDQEINTLEKYLDSIFIKLITKYIQHSPEIFYNFTKRVEADTFAKFMIGNCRLVDYFKVIMAMPKRFILFWILGINKSDN